jgi:hypothetical protein
MMSCVTNINNSVSASPFIRHVKKENLTSLGAIRYDRVMDFSSGISAFVLPMMRRQSPEVTAFTLPLSHPDGPVVAAMIAGSYILK